MMGAIGRIAFFFNRNDLFSNTSLIILSYSSKLFFNKLIRRTSSIFVNFIFYCRDRYSEIKRVCAKNASKVRHRVFFIASKANYKKFKILKIRSSYTPIIHKLRL